MSAQHASDDGSYTKSSSAAAARGMVLIAVAVLIGVFLLGRGFDDGTVLAGPPDSGTDGPRAADGDGGGSEDDGSGTTSTTLASIRPVEQVKVLVANASGVSGAAGRATEQFQSENYNALSPTNALEQVDATRIFFAEGFDREAALVAQVLGAPSSAAAPVPVPAPVEDSRGADIIVVLGPDLATSG